MLTCNSCTSRKAVCVHTAHSFYARNFKLISAAKRQDRFTLKMSKISRNKLDKALESIIDIHNNPNLNPSVLGLYL